MTVHTVFFVALALTPLVFSGLFTAPRFPTAAFLEALSQSEYQERTIAASGAIDVQVASAPRVVRPMPAHTARRWVPAVNQSSTAEHSTNHTDTPRATATYLTEGPDRPRWRELLL